MVHDRKKLTDLTQVPVRHRMMPVMLFAILLNGNFVVGPLAAQENQFRYDPLVIPAGGFDSMPMPNVPSPRRQSWPSNEVSQISATEQKTDVTLSIGETLQQLVGAQSGSGGQKVDEAEKVDLATRLQREKASSLFAGNRPKHGNPIDLQKLLKKIAASTFLVLCVGVGGVVLMKRIGFKGTGKADRNVVVPEDSVLEKTIRLGGHRMLEIVRIDKTRLVVGSDSGGIKSIVPISSTFASAIQNLDHFSQSEPLQETPATESSNQNEEAENKVSDQRRRETRRVGETDSDHQSESESLTLEQELERFPELKKLLGR